MCREICDNKYLIWWTKIVAYGKIYAPVKRRQTKCLCPSGPVAKVQCTVRLGTARVDLALRNNATPAYSRRKILYTPEIQCVTCGTFSWKLIFFLFIQVDMYWIKQIWQALLFINGYRCMEYTSSSDFKHKILHPTPLPARPPAMSLLG